MVARLRRLRAFGPAATAGLTVAGVVLAAASLAAQFPRPSGPVNDFANVLGESDVRELTDLVQAVEQETSAQIAVATVSSLNGMSVEEYAVKLFADWGIGRSDRDNGVLILVAPSEREMRIEVGYGLEGVLPDGLAGEVIRTEFLPRFRENDYPGGIQAGTRRVAEIVRRNETLTAEQRAALDRQAEAANEDATWVLVPFLSIFVAVGFGLGGTGIGARAIGPIVFGLFFGGMPLAMALMAGVSLGIWILVAVAVAALIVGTRYGRRPSYRASLRGRSKGTKSGWVWGGSSGGRGSSGWGGGSSSGGGFGGGSSGGGGASGRW